MVVVRNDGFDAVTDEVEGADGIAACWIAEGEVGGKVELLSVGGRDFSLVCVE